MNEEDLILHMKKFRTVQTAEHHEIKNALSGFYWPSQSLTIYGCEDLARIYEEFLKNKVPKAAEHKFLAVLDQLKQEGEKLFAKAEEIRIIAKTAEGTFPSLDGEEFEAFNCRNLLDTVNADQGKDAYLLTVEAPDPLFAYGRMVLIRQVFVNFIHYVIEIGEGQAIPKITVRANYLDRDGKKGVSFEFHSSEVVVPKEIENKIFGPVFYAKPKSLDRGVQGLWVSRWIIEELHGGKMSIEAGLGKGSVFKVWLPFKESQESLEPMAHTRT